MAKQLVFIFIVFVFSACGSNKAFTGKKQLKRTVDQAIEVQMLNDSIQIFGTLTLPKSESAQVPLAIIVPGSGPTDRDCNNPMGKSNTYKMIAEGLMERGIAVLRYDKRMIGASAGNGLTEADLRFDDMIDDVHIWINLFKEDKRFNKIIVMGHSEGSLIGMMAARRGEADKFISLAGPGRAADVILLDQIRKQMPFAVPQIEKIFNQVKKGEVVKDIDPSLATILRPSVQPYLASWFKWDPSIEIARLTMPILIVQGSTDIQVGVKEAQLLHKASNNSTLKILEGTNHIFKDAPTDFNENIKTYTDPDLPLNTEVLDILSAFILN